MSVLNTSDIIGRSFILPPQEDGKSSGSILLKLLITMKQIQHNTLVTPISYVLLMMINMKRFFHTTKSSITFQTKRMKILYVSSNVLFHIREHLTNPLPITNNPIVM